jgi:LasA protease
LKTKRTCVLTLIGMLFLSGCYKPYPGSAPWQASGLEDLVDNVAETVTVLVTPPALDEDIPEIIAPTPTPNSPIVLPTPRDETVTYTVQGGDTLRNIAQSYQVSVSQLIVANGIVNPDLIEVGKVLLIPPPSFDDMVTSFKIIPDSELVYSPSNASFDITEFVMEKGGFLVDYSEVVDDVNLSGAQIVERVALEYSVNPRLLLTVLEYQSGWVTEQNPAEETLDYPMRYYDPQRAGLYKQLGWAANLLNEGYYSWKENSITVWILLDNSFVMVDPTINPGTAGVLNLMRFLKSKSEWDLAISEGGIFATFFTFFGYPFDLAFEPIIPDDLTQPSLELPFEPGESWSYTGGPHGGWASGSAWAALDFAPPGEPRGCYPSDAWVVASASGQIVYADHGTVIQDLDGDGIWQTGWSILYMHIESMDRVEVGEYLDSGDRIGHPSCEGGVSTGTHLHIARRYNGEWIAADGDLPMVMDGWVPVGYGVEYDGYLIKGDQTLEAWNGRTTRNVIQR